MGLFGFTSKRKQTEQLRSALDDIHSKVFPGGDSDVQRDIQMVKSITNGKISNDDLMYFTIKCKTLFYVASDKYDSRRFIESFLFGSDKKITKDEAYNIYAVFLREYLDKAT